MGFLHERFPELVEGYSRLYPGRAALPLYAERVAKRAARYRADAGLGERYEVKDGTDEPRQLALL